MYKHILIPTDGSPTAEKAVQSGLEFAREAGARVTLFTAVPEYEVSEAQMLARRPIVSITEHDRRSERRAREVLAPAEARARALGVDFDIAFLQSNHPSEAIVAAARNRDCDAIFMATHGRTGVARLFHGSETEEVLTHSAIPTLVYR